jgi:glycosyltransferase involved in cell wall biosynthesis
MTPKVSVIMPLYNGEKWITATLKSLQAQTFRDFEAILLNDGSTDGTARAVRPFLEDKRLRYFEKAHEGIPRTRNKALSLAQGEYVAFLDQDDLYEPGKLEAQVAVLEKSPEVGTVYTRVNLIDAEGRWLTRWPAPRPREGRILEALLKKWSPMLLVSVMTRRSIAEAVGPFNESLWGTDDFDWILRMADLTPFALIPKSLAAWRWHPGTATKQEGIFTDQFILISKVRARWPQHSALVAGPEGRAHRLYGDFLVKNGRLPEAYPHFLAARKLRRFDLSAGLKSVITWFRLRR